ncbi:MAG TPA: glycosyltransferase family 39 protein [Terriglobales bacterium]|nr:glycosyltransferase family 39 protein [Terriglobales bacterium]
MSSSPVSETESTLRTPANRTFASLLILISLWAAIYVAGMFTPPLLDDADSLHAEAAREMLQRHDWVTLYTDGIRYLEKAPLMYWGIACSYLTFGVSDWSTRLPLVLTVLALILFTYLLGKRVYGEKGGFWSALVLATSVGPYLFTRFQIPDVMVGLWLTIGLYFFLCTLDEQQPSRLACWGFAATCALNVLTKSLIGLVFPLAIIGLYLIATGNLTHLHKMRLFSSTLVFLAIAAPWHVLAALRNPAQGATRGFLWFYFVNEQFLRYLNKRVPPGYDTVPLLIFWALLLVWLLPWVIFLPQALREVKLRLHFDRASKARLLFLIWVGVIVIFFSFSTRQEYYTLPALPGLALLTGGWLAKEAESSSDSLLRRAGRISSYAFLAIVVTGCLIGLKLLLESQIPAPGADLAELLKKNPAEYNLSMGHFLDLTPQALGLFRIPLLVCLISLFLGAGLNVLFRSQRRPIAGNIALAAMMIPLFACVHSGFAAFSPILSSASLAQPIRANYHPGDLIVVDGEYHQASTLNFYTGVPVLVLHEPSGNLWFGSKFPDAPHVFLTQSGFDELWRDQNTVFLWTDQDDPKELRGLQQLLLAKSGGKSIFTNHPLGH